MQESKHGSLLKDGLLNAGIEEDLLGVECYVRSVDRMQKQKFNGDCFWEGNDEC